MTNRQILEQEQLQKQTQTINQRQTMIARILDSGMDLQEIVSRELDTNPALELEEDDLTNSQRDISLDELKSREDREPSANDDSTDDWDSDNYAQIVEGKQDEGTERGTELTRDDWEPNRYDTRTSSNDNDGYERQDAATNSFYDDLLHQLDELVISESDKEIAAYIIGNIEKSGHLHRSVQDLSDDLLITYGKRVAATEIERVLCDIVQTLEPTGVGARNIAECLSIQLRTLQEQHKNNYLISKALNIIENHFEAFSNKRFETIAHKESLSSEEFETVKKIIQRLTPYPGPGEDTEYINPDFLIEIENGRLKLTLAKEYKPKLRVNREYEDFYKIYRDKKNTEAAKSYKELINKANHFIDIFPEISKTLYQVMATILVFQEEFFLTGDPKRLKPMILRDIAEKLDLDESTISRCTSHRYAQTPHGFYLLKDLFSEATNKEEGVSALAIKEHIRELIDNEDKRNPLTDEKVVDLLKQQGFQISRRTVAKYRDQLGISATSVRKRL